MLHLMPDRVNGTERISLTLAWLQDTPVWQDRPFNRFNNL
jgi:hypothetical protein